MASKEERELKRLAALDAQMRVQVQELQEIDSLLAERKSSVFVAEKKEQEALDRFNVLLSTIKEKNDEIDRMEAYVESIAMKEGELLSRIQENEVIVAYQNITIANLTVSIKQKTLDEQEAHSSLSYVKLMVADTNKKVAELQEYIRNLKAEIESEKIYKEDILKAKERIATEIEVAISDFKIYEQRINMLEEKTGYTVKKPKL